MEPHIHSGFIVFATVGVYAILFIQLIRLLAASLHKWPVTEKIGSAIGATVNFGA
jgi:hypothetical protein